MTAIDSSTFSQPCMKKGKKREKEKKFSVVKANYFVSSVSVNRFIEIFSYTWMCNKAQSKKLVSRKKSEPQWGCIFYFVVQACLNFSVCLFRLRYCHLTIYKNQKQIKNLVYVIMVLSVAVTGSCKQTYR